EHEQHREHAAEESLGERLGEERPALGRGGRDDADEDRRPPTDVAVSLLRPCPCDHRRHDGKQRRPGCLVLRQAERDEHRHEEDAAADAEQPGEYARNDAERDRDDVRHLKNNQTAVARIRAANDTSSVRVRNRCCSVPPPTAPTAAGRPTRAAYFTSTSPWNA